MTVDRIRVGIVGATVTPGGSGWGANAHVPALRALPQYELKAVCTAHESTAKASAAAFGAELAFDDVDRMAAHPEIDLVAVVVRVPRHRELVMAGLRAGKAVFCEWPLGVDLAQAQEMADFARERSLPTLVGLQARSDPTVRYARDMIADGFVGEVLAANLILVGQAVLERGPGRIWQGVRANGANTLTITAGHSIDALCFILGEFAELSARVATRIGEWRQAETGTSVPVDAPDTVSLVGRLVGGAEVAVQIASVPSNPRGSRLEIYGREGALFLTGGLTMGPRLQGARGAEAASELVPPDRYTLVPAGTAPGPHRNVAQAYARFADAFRAKRAGEPDFDAAVTRHHLIETIERSSNQGGAMALTDARRS